jgi:hypothetical protein
MTEDMHELMRTALLEPDGDPPVEELVRRGRARRLRRRAALVAVPVLALVAGLLVVPGLLDERVELAPAEPGAPAPGGWPVQVRYELVDLHYVEVEQLPDEGGPVPLDIWEFAGNSWDDWYSATVVRLDLDRAGWSGSPDGSPRAGVGVELWHTGQAAGARRYVDGVGLSLMEDQPVSAYPDEPFATIRAVMDPSLEWDDRFPAVLDGPAAPGPVFGRMAVDYRALPGVRHLDEHIPEQHRGEWEDLRDRVGGALGLHPDDLSAVVYEEPFCFRDPVVRGPSLPTEVCAMRDDAKWIRWARVWHTATQIPLYVHWAEADWEDNPDALQVTMLRVTHIELTTNGTERPPVEPQTDLVTLELAPEVVAIGGHVEARYTNNTAETLSYGAGWVLERWQDGDWAPAEPLPPDHAWPAPEYLLDPGETRRDLIPTEHLAPGRYRYTKEFDRLHGTRFTAVADFEVVAGSDDATADSNDTRDDWQVHQMPADDGTAPLTDEEVRQVVERARHTPEVAQVLDAVPVDTVWVQPGDGTGQGGGPAGDERAVWVVFAFDEPTDPGVWPWRGMCDIGGQTDAWHGVVAHTNVVADWVVSSPLWLTGSNCMSWWPDDPPFEFTEEWD